MGEKIRKTEIKRRSLLSISLFFVLIISLSLFVKLSLVRRAFVGPDGFYSQAGLIMIF